MQQPVQHLLGQGLKVASGALLLVGQGVVLVGEQGLLGAALGAQGQPGVGAGRGAQGLLGPAEEAAGEGVGEEAHLPGDGLYREPRRQHLLHDGLELRAVIRKRAGVVGLRKPAQQGQRGLEPAPQEGPVGQQAHHLMALGERQVVDALLLHVGQGFVEGVLAGRVLAGALATRAAGVL